jgi:hypothetical protein
MKRDRQTSPAPIIRNGKLGWVWQRSKRKIKFFFRVIMRQNATLPFQLAATD